MYFKNQVSWQIVVFFFFFYGGVYDEILYVLFNRMILFYITSFILFNILLNLFYKIKKSFCIVKEYIE